MNGMKLIILGVLVFAVGMTRALDESQAGVLYTPRKGPAILLWDARTNSTDRILRRFQSLNDPAKRGPGLSVTTERTPLSAEEAFGAAKAKLNADVALVVVAVNAGANQPRLSVFPEERIGVINADKIPALMNEKLFVREFWRAVGFVGGAGYAPYRGCVMQPVFDDRGLATLMGDVLQPMTLQSFKKFEDKVGMKRTRLVSYEVACYEGWAPDPTNEVQKVIWTEVKEELAQEPTNPIKIQK